jgi:thiol-disulfide isomerase/thioredoxin
VSALRCGLLSCADVGGLRFVEYFSPFCHHCRAFKPTWDELVNNYAESLVNFAQVDCIIYGGMSNLVYQILGSLSEIPTDLCTSNGVNGYPQMNLYHDGALRVTFTGMRNYDGIVNFIKEHTGVSDPSRSAPLPEVPEPEHDLQSPHGERNPHGEVLALTPETFPSVVANGDVFVKFFAPWWVFCFLWGASSRR